MHHSKKITLISFLFLGSMFGFWGVPTVHAIEYGGLGISPHVSEVDPKDPLTKAWFIYTLDSGELKNGKVTVTNTSGERVVVRVYPVDAVTTKDGAFAPQSEDNKSVGVGSWIALRESEILLGPRESKTVDFTIRVPDGSDVGDHMGAIIVQSVEPTGGIEGSGLRITTRVGVRVYITVPGDMVKKLVFGDFVEETQDRVVTFASTFVNEGNVRIRLKGNIEITNSKGIVVGDVSIPEREVFPGKTITIPITFEPQSTLEGVFKAAAFVIYEGGKPLVQELTFSISKMRQPLNLALVSSVSAGVGVGLAIAALLFGIIYLARRRNMKAEGIV